MWVFNFFVKAPTVHRSCVESGRYWWRDCNFRSPAFSLSVLPCPHQSFAFPALLTFFFFFFSLWPHTEADVFWNHHIKPKVSLCVSIHNSQSSLDRFLNNYLITLQVEIVSHHIAHVSILLLLLFSSAIDTLRAEVFLNQRIKQKVSIRVSIHHSPSFTVLSRYRFLNDCLTTLLVEIVTSHYPYFDSSSSASIWHTESRRFVSHRTKQKESHFVSIYPSQSFAFVSRYRYLNNCVITLPVEIVAHCFATFHTCIRFLLEISKHHSSLNAGKRNH